MAAGMNGMMFERFTHITVVLSIYACGYKWRGNMDRRGLNEV